MRALISCRIAKGHQSSSLSDLINFLCIVLEFYIFHIKGIKISLVNMTYSSTPSEAHAVVII